MVESEEGTTLRISGLNVQIVNGEGATASTNALGNLILGYNEPSQETARRTGSHNLVLGSGNPVKKPLK